MEKGTEVVLSCADRYWCPVVKFDGQRVTISDDNGNCIKMLPENWNSLVQKVQRGELGPIIQG